MPQAVGGPRCRKCLRDQLPEMMRGKVAADRREHVHGLHGQQLGGQVVSDRDAALMAAFPDHPQRVGRRRLRRPHGESWRSQRGAALSPPHGQEYFCARVEIFAASKLGRHVQMDYVQLFSTSRLYDTAGSLSGVLGQMAQAVAQRVQSWDPNDLLNAPVDDVVDELVDAGSVHCPQLCIDDVFMLDPTEVKQEFTDFVGRRGTRRVTRLVLVVPFQGEKDVFTLRQTTSPRCHRRYCNWETKKFASPLTTRRAIQPRSRGDSTSRSRISRSTSVGHADRSIFTISRSATKCPAWWRNVVSNFSRLETFKPRSAIRSDAGRTPTRTPFP